ncbi:gliding motility-associated protein GldE [Flavobacteriales bacterium]|nr:gliding motility-associated protein GldE [Flavobacteriales bacterium]
MEEVPISLLSIFNGIEFHLFNADVLLSFLTVILLIFFSAFISGAEVAYFSLDTSDLEELEKDGETVLKLLKNPNQLLATILIANNFINVGIIVISAFITSRAISFPEGSNLEFAFQVIVITSLLVLFGEITPKVYANNNPISFSLKMSKPLVFLDKLFYPLSYILVTTTSFIDKRLAAKQTEISIEEISKALDITEHESKEEERRILRSIVEFGNTDVKEIMKSRVDVLAIDKTIKFSDLLKVIVSSGYSRIPVYEGKFDNVLGVLYIKDLIPHLDGDKDEFNWLSLCRAPYFVPETKMINDLLKEFQLMKNHLAIVVDEYGGTSGIVTLEDVLEEIVGEINDEFDVDDNIYSKLDDKNYIFEGKISLIDFLKIIKGENDYFDDLKGESDSLAGLILEVKGRIPKIGEVCEIPPYTMVVESADLRRIKRVKVTINEG